MKRFFLGTFLIFFAVSVTSAQEYKKQLKSANKSLGKYYLDPVTNKALLNDAITTINNVFTADDAKADPEAWITKGQIFNEIAKAEMNRKIVTPDYVIATPEAGEIAFDAFQNAIAKGTKKSHTKDALSGIRENEDYLNNLGAVALQTQNFNMAYKNFSASLKAHDILKSNKEASRLDDATAKNDQTYYTAISGYYGDFKNETLPLFETLYKAEKPLASVYEALFTLNSQKDVNKAMEYLEEGRKAYPDDNSLLFAEINFYLSTGKLDVLTDKLKTAIAKEPDNITVYTTLANVYDQLNQKERSAGNIAKADDYFNLALDYYSQAIVKNPKNFDANYGSGALYYNKAASMTSRLNEVSNDFTSAGTKKFNAIKAEMDGYFKQALPYFLKAESIEPKDQNTMIALKEIYAREGNLEKSIEYKSKIEKSGGN